MMHTTKRKIAKEILWIAFAILIGYITAIVSSKPNDDGFHTIAFTIVGVIYGLRILLWAFRTIQDKESKLESKGKSNV
ncbi:MAG: hypothetical protein JNL72_02525 [Flavipsychrobacter sp.]|nr:hypothetical protein [Flavipsychrobacter sp.]